MSNDTCNWLGCERPVAQAGYCPRDYYRSRKVGNPENPWIAWEARSAAAIAARASRICKWPECDATKIHAHGMCKSCYQRGTFVDDMKEPWKLWKPGGHCIVCGAWADGPNRGQKYCSPACNMLDWKRNNIDRVRELGREHTRRRRAQISSTTVDRFTDKDVRADSGDNCYLCTKKINFDLPFPHPKSPSLDHVVPISKGGTHTLSNVAMTHFACNQKKGVREATGAPQPTLFTM